MVGNNLERDIVGANRFGITSVFIKWSPRYPMEPKNEEEVPVISSTNHWNYWIWWKN